MKKKVIKLVILKRYVIYILYNNDEHNLDLGAAVGGEY